MHQVSKTHKFISTKHTSIVIFVLTSCVFCAAGWYSGPFANSDHSTLITLSSWSKDHLHLHFIYIKIFPMIVFPK